MENSDIYNMSQVLLDLQNDMIEEEDQDTLALGTFGYFNAALSKMISTNIRIAADNSNEVFPTKAKYEKNIIMHSIINGIDNINAVPAKIPVLFSMLQEGLDQLLESTNNKFILSEECPIMVGDYEYHFQYPVVISKQIIENEQFVYTARYDTTYKNCLSDITNPFLPSPYIMKKNMYSYVFLYCELIQVERSVDTRKIIGDNPIENKTYQFTFENQLADFRILAKDDDKTTVITPVFEGSDIPTNTENYCWYSYLDNYTIRIKFDLDSYMPTTNTEIDTIIYTTHGEECNFEYKNNFVFTLEDTDNYIYNNLEIYLSPQGNSEGGSDKKTIEELKRLLPKVSQSRGNIISDEDIANHFSLFNTKDTKILPKRKVYNQIMNEFYLYFMNKDSNGNIVPTNTISIKLDTDKAVKYESASGINQYIFNQGTIIGFNKENQLGEIIEDIDEETKSNYEFIYMLPYRTVINDDGPIVSYYMDNAYKQYSCYYSYINENAPIQFISPYFSIQKNNDSNSYTLLIEIKQNIESDVGMIVKKDTEEIIDNSAVVNTVLYMDDEDSNELSSDKASSENNIITDFTDYTVNCIAVAVMYNEEGTPYRYFVGELISYSNDVGFNYLYKIKFTTDNIMDNDNKIKLIDGHLINTPMDSEATYGFMSGDEKISIYILAKFKDSDGNPISYGLNGLNTIITDIEEYTCTNVYTTTEANGINLFENFTEVTNSAVEPSDNSFILSDVPVIGYNYSLNKDLRVAFFNAVRDYKSYIDKSLPKLIKPFGIDFKFYNTYGPSFRYYVNSDRTNALDRTNITLNFEIKLKKSSDNYTKNYIIRDIQNIIESFDRDDDIYIANIISEIYNNYQNSIYYISYTGINNFDATNQSLLINTIDGYDKVTPEFICINKLEDGTPDINVKLI